MVSVASLLNHDSDLEQLLTPTPSTRCSSEFSPAPSERPSKKPKLAKDAAVFQKSKVKGQVLYVPYETVDGKVLEEMRRLNVYPLPLSKIADFPRHIPYNSDKKQLYQKTGRDAFEGEFKSSSRQAADYHSVFQYTFQPPGHDREYAVLWDYNIGLVRMTPFFKCCRYPKICHSITGGALVAQGYWVPYEAAKALASTFCWEFRYALVPVFGPDFPERCVRPGSDAYSTMIIDEKLIRKCAQDVEMFRSMQRKNIVKPTEQFVMVAAGADGNKPSYDGVRYHSSFQPINRPTSMPIEAPMESSYPFLRTPLHTPKSSCLSSPAMSALDSTSPAASSYPISSSASPQTPLEYKSQEVQVPSSAPGSPISSDGDVSPKTIPRKSRYSGRIRAQASQRKGGRIGVELETNKISEADIRAAEILLDLRAAVQKARQEAESDY